MRYSAFNWEQSAFSSLGTVPRRRPSDLVSPPAPGYAAPWHLCHVHAVGCCCCTRAGDTQFAQPAHPTLLPSKGSRLPSPLEHLLNVFLAVLGRRFQVVQPLPHCVHLGFELLDLRAQLVLERWDGYRNKPASAH